MKVSNPVRNDTWNMLLDLERQTRYYGRLADRYSRWRRVIRYLLLFGLVAEATVVLLLLRKPRHALGPGGAGALMLGSLTVFDASTDYGRLAAELRMASLLCEELNVDAARLWRDIEVGRIDDPQAETRYNSLNQSQGGIYICGALKIGQGTPVKLFHPYVEDGPSPLLALRHMHISPWYQFSRPTLLY